MMEDLRSKRGQIISRLNNLLELKYIYKTDCFGTFLFVIILKGNCSSLTQELSAMVAKIFQEETDSLFRIFSFEYAEQQLRKGNLFFLHGCRWGKVVFKDSDSELDVFHEYTANEKAVNNIEASFQREYTKIMAFMDGTVFFIEKENYPQAAFMLHQYIELWYRYAALFIMGKERKSHNIKELQTYLNVFAPQLGRLFNTEIEEERILLKLLDDAYVTTRYGNNYHITKEQIDLILKKASVVETVVSKLFYDKLEACEHSENITAVKSSCKPPDDSPPFPTKTYKGLLDQITEELSNRKEHLKPAGYQCNGKPMQKSEFSIGDNDELMFSISCLLKTCVLALEGQETFGLSPLSNSNPKGNVVVALEFIIGLLPRKQMVCLDEISKILSKIDIKEV
ncbi:HEPN domain-containing protein [Zhouia spongiae]|uniref:HEPN domain-containing protein n=1 Tax=Zhouia spongiae TaxID=2202721 RepID=A0ABY3YIR4_9FLAO|nr:HEPN domain-containing protein [Zhouia spongiae]UNY97754.1 HEPN domain-containing protein [Zhouia spongiae]